MPTIRGSNIQSSSASSYTVSFPAGTLAGDLAVLFAGHAWTVNTPSGWTAQNALPAANFGGAVFSRVLTSGDISTGSVTVTTTGTFNGVLAIVTFVGNPGIR